MLASRSVRLGGAMRVAIVNIGTIVSGDLARAVRQRRHDRHRRRSHPRGRHGVGAGGRSLRRGDRCRPHDRHSRADRFACAHHVRRLHAATADCRLSGKLPAWRGDDGDQRLGSPCSRPAARCRGRQGARGRGAKMLRALPAGRHDGPCRLGHPRADAHRQRPGRDRQEGRVARQGRLRRLQDRVRVRAARSPPRVRTA